MRRSKNDEVRKTVRETYGRTAEADGSGCGCGPSPCCGSGEAPSVEDIAVRLGYSREDASAAPAGANMGLGCGNPQAIASLQPGETVLDLGSGGGFDCFLAAKAVGETGRVIGVDMTPEMVARARENAAKAGLDNVEFRLGEIEHLPVPDASVDVIISNCVVNLSPEKPEVFQEAFRVLRPGGRLAITDVVATAELPESVKNDLALHAGCVAGAAQVSELESMLADAGFSDVHIRPLDGSRELIAEWAPGEDLARFIASATVEAVKPPSV
ncbi:MAG: arsenite methyltransferase [Planctomycetota bacterium]|jgi:SAM-dependent methyltransferase